jgi:tetratricopeptide (TPR) repeat protein
LPETDSIRPVTAIDLARAATGTGDAASCATEADRLYRQGLALSTVGDDEPAAALLEHALVLAPQRSDIAYNLGIIHRDLGRRDRAMELWQQVLALDSGHGDAWLSLATAIEDEGDAPAALALYRQAIERVPGDRALLYNCADLSHRSGDLDAAARLYEQVTRADPDFASAWLNCGMVLKQLGRLEAAEACYRRAGALGDAAGRALAEFNLANLLLQQRRWTEGFAAYEARLALPEAPRPDFGLPRWTRATPPGALLLWNDQGYGDTIQFLRYAPLLAARGQRVLLYLRDPLKRLAITVPGVETAFGLTEDPPAAAAELPICSLVAALDLTEPGPWPGPYLTAPPAPDLPMDAGKRYRIALVWAGNPAHINDHHRSLGLADLAPLFAGRGDIEWCSLQTGPRAGDLAGADPVWPIRDLSPRLHDFAETAALLGRCDLLIAVDTAIVHLAGALGIKAWVLLPAIETDWRWGTEGDASVWYPSLRLFRQPRAGNWAPVMTAIRTALAEEFPYGI